MDIRELRIEDRVSNNGDIGEVVEIKTTHARLFFKDDASYLYAVISILIALLISNWDEAIIKKRK